MSDLLRHPLDLLRRRHVCPGCQTEIPRIDGLCPACADSLPDEVRRPFYLARALRAGDPDGFADALDRALAWLATHPRPDAATQTNAKEA